MALKTIIVDNTSDVTEVMGNPDTLEAVITVCTAINTSGDNQTFQLLLGTGPDDRRVIYKGTVPANGELNMDKKFSIPANKKLYMSTSSTEGYAVFSLYQQSIDMAAIEGSIDDKLNEARQLRDETASLKNTVVDKEALVNPHYTAIDTVANNINAINHANQLITQELTSYKGDYDSGTTYALGDGVSYNGGIYVSKQDSNTGNTPDEANSSYWVLVTSQTSADKVTVDANAISGLDATDAQGAFAEHQGDINDLQVMVKAVSGDSDLADHIRVKDRGDNTIWHMYIENGEIKLESE